MFKKKQTVKVTTRTAGVLVATYIKCHPGARGDYHEVMFPDGATSKVRASQIVAA